MKNEQESIMHMRFCDNKKYRIAILSDMPLKSYSGGRYHAAILAECVAAAGNEVYFVTNGYSPFWHDFMGFPEHNRIKFVFTGNFDMKIKISSKFDYVLVVPSLRMPDIFYKECRNFCIRYAAKLIFLNFETPNWYNMYSKWKREDEQWDVIRKYLCELGGVILSSADESMKYAKAFYGLANKKLYYDVWNPAINSIVADEVFVKKKNQIIALVRLSDKHKGADDILNIISQPMPGYKIVLIAGNGKVSKSYQKKMDELSNIYGYTYEILKRVNDREKFIQIKHSKILLFPSYFEGYGYPPVEAQYCNTLCLAYELPVLKEINGEGIQYCKYGDSNDMKQKLREYIIGKEIFHDMKESIAERGNIANRVAAIQKILEKYENVEFDLKKSNMEKVKICNYEELKYYIKSNIKFIISSIKIRLERR